MEAGEATYTPFFGAQLSPTLGRLTARRQKGIAAAEQLSLDRCLMLARSRFRFVQSPGVGAVLFQGMLGALGKVTL